MGTEYLIGYKEGLRAAKEKLRKNPAGITLGWIEAEIERLDKRIAELRERGL